MKSFQFFLMIFTILGINYYVFNRLIYMLPRVMALRGIVVAFAVVVVSCLFTYLFAGKVLPGSITSVMYTIGTSWLIASIYFLLIFLILDIIRLFGGGFATSLLYSNALSFGVLVTFVGLLLYGGNLSYKNKKRVELNLPIAKMKSTTPLKIVAVSDLHLGHGIGKRELAKWVELINQEEPDIVLMAGDVVDMDIRPLRKQEMHQLFKQIKSKHGVYAVPGNHEYFADILECQQFMDQAGVRLLRDEAVLIDNRFYIIGRDDRTYYGRKNNIYDLIDDLDTTKPMIVLDHQPFDLEDAARGKVDLQISGHTHYGQIWPVSWITNAIYERAHGYIQKEDTHIYVSSGLGIWGGKFRVGTQSEYVVINLNSAN